MNKLASAFQHGKALIPYFTCGDPNLETTAAALQAAEANGADLVVLGIPFSDPTAEGPVLQGASLRALAGGATTDKIFQTLRSARQQVHIPLVFMTYANVVFSYGGEAFFAACEELGVEGLILADLPFEEKGEFQDLSRAHGVALISILAPTSAQRIARIAREAEGFLCLMAGLELGEDLQTAAQRLAEQVAAVRTCTSVPCVVGFGVTDGRAVETFARLADGVVVDTPMVRLLEQYGKGAPEQVAACVQRLKASISG